MHYPNHAPRSLIKRNTDTVQHCNIERIQALCGSVNAVHSRCPSTMACFMDSLSFYIRTIKRYIQSGSSPPAVSKQGKHESCFQTTKPCRTHAKDWDRERDSTIHSWEGEARLHVYGKYCGDHGVIPLSCLPFPSLAFR